MPVLHFPLARLQAALGKETDVETLRAKLPMLGTALDKSDGDEWSVEVFPDRPDLLSPELLGRALRGFLGYEPGLASYELAAATETLHVDPSVVPVRPIVVAGAAHGIELDEAGLKGLMELQEDLHWGLGARRRKVSVGIHDARDVQGPYTFKAVDPDTVRFVPLHDTREMTMREMVTDIEKGRDYAHLVEPHDVWPLIVDKDDRVLSFPPIINGTATTLTEDTTDVLVDVTGTDERACRAVLNIVMTHLGELGGALQQVTVSYPDGSEELPDLTPSDHAVSCAHARRLLGIEFSPDEACEALRRMGHEARVGDGRDTLEVRAGAWRTDLLHEVDLIEDIAIGLDLTTFLGTEPKAITFGQALPTEQFGEQVRRALAGLGYLECITLTLTSVREQQDLFGTDEPVIAMQNPETSENAVARRRLLPGLLTLAARNVHRDLPQHLFELGDVIVPDPDGGRPPNRRRVAGLVIASDAGFTGVKSHVEALLRSLGLRWREAATTAPGFVAGRCAELTDPDTGRVLGTYGELAPAVITAFELSNPCAGFELELRPFVPLETFAPEEDEAHRLDLRGA